MTEPTNRVSLQSATLDLLCRNGELEAAEWLAHRWYIFPMFESSEGILADAVPTPSWEDFQAASKLATYDVKEHGEHTD